MNKVAAYARKTRETDISVRVALYGEGRIIADTGFGFFDHMLQQLAHHSLMDIEVKATGDIKTGFHHLTEDIGICLGRALRQAVSGGEGGNGSGNENPGETGVGRTDRSGDSSADRSEDEGRGDNGGASPIRRFGSATVPMDGSLCRVALDFSGRGSAYIDAPGMDEDIAEFVKAFAREAGITLHMDVLKSDNRHHATEGCFKALALSVRAALEPDAARNGSSSSKGCIG